MVETAVEVANTPGARTPENGPADWSVQFMQFVIRAAARSQQNVELSRRILEHAARGQLPAHALQDSTAELLQSGGHAYAQQVAALSGRFFAGLVQASAGMYREPVPLSSESADPIEWFQQIADYAARLNASAVERYQSDLERAAAGETLAASAFVPNRLPEHLGHVARLCFDLLNGLADLGAGCEEHYLRRVLATAGGWHTVTPLTLHLVAPLGEVASASLSLENSRDERIVIRCAVLDVRRADGVGPAFTPRIAVVPDAFTLEPEKEAGVRLSLPLDAAYYEPDTPYIGGLRVTRHGDSPLEVALRIIATSPAGRADSRRDPR
jgi:hypothetical protein